MRLDNQDIEKIAQGIENAGIIDGALHFSRLPAGLAEHYRNDSGSLIRLECPSGVRLKFLTNASALRIGMRFGRAARPLYIGAILIENISEPLVFGPDKTVAQWHGTISLPVSGSRAMRAVEVWLPHLVRCDLLDFEIINGTWQPFGKDNAPRWLACGDSITQGMTAQLPCDTWTSLCARHLNLNLRNFGIGGACMETFYASTPIDFPYDLLTIAFGVNDFNSDIPADQHIANLTAFLNRQYADHPRAQRIVITPIPWIGRTYPNRYGMTLSEYSRAVFDAVHSLPAVTAVRGTDIMPEDKKLYIDDIHPNDAGMTMYAAGIERVLANLI